VIEWFQKTGNEGTLEEYEAKLNTLASTCGAILKRVSAGKPSDEGKQSS
jgi:hypothetical protein